MNKNKQIYSQGDKIELKAIQEELKCAIRKERLVYKKKIEDMFLNNDMRKVWSGMRLMSGYASKSGNSAPLPDVSVDYANELNSFYNRFDSQDFSNEVKEIFEIPDGNPEPFISISKQDVKSHFSRPDA